MEVLYLLIPMSVLLVFALMALFRWALDAGQFDDLEREGERILAEDLTPIDAHQAPPHTRVEQSGAAP